MNRHGSLPHLLHRASQVASEQFDLAMGDDELTERQIVVMAAIGSAEGASQTDIVEATGVDRSTLADIVHRLTKRGLILRRRSRSDARAYVLKLSDGGRAAIAKGIPILDGIERDMLAPFSPKQRADLMQMLVRLVEGTKSGS